jgi:hypothetical protein
LSKCFRHIATFVWHFPGNRKSIEIIDIYYPKIGQTKNKSTSMCGMVEKAKINLPIP